MDVPEEIRDAASALGKSLRQSDYLRPYLDAIEIFQADPEARALEMQLYDTYSSLLTRQQAGEKLSSEETQAFYDLRRRAQIHPVISRRENALRLLKPYLVQIAEEISALLGMDYTTLARSE